MMKDWDKDLSTNAKYQMKFLGDFSPTCNKGYEEIKGYMMDNDGGGSYYLDADDLIKLSDACAEVSRWLKERALEDD